MNEVEILVEEKSMQTFLENVLPQILPKHWVYNHNYFIRSFNGKHDLQKNIPKKIKALSHKPQIGFIIIHDQDSNDCINLKSEIINMINKNSKNKNLKYLVRIPCKELESWYLGDFMSLRKCFTHIKLDNYNTKTKYRNPDKLQAKDELKKLLNNNYKPIETAKNISTPLIENIANNNSKSFKITIEGIKKFFNAKESVIS